MTREELLNFPAVLMSWLMQDPLAAGLLSAALVLVMLAVVLRWAVRRPAVAPVVEIEAPVEISEPVAPAPVAAAAAPVLAVRQRPVPTTEELVERVDDLAEEVIALRRQLCDTEALLRRQADKLNYLEQHFEQQPVQPLRVQDDDNERQAGYEQAMLLAANGLPVQELMVQCGLTRPEAQLIVLLHGRGGQA